MWTRIYKGWQEIPQWAKLLPVTLLLAGLSVAHFAGWFHSQLLPTGLSRLFFLPLFMLSLLWGLRGGVLCAALISLNYLPDLLLLHHPGAIGPLAALMEIVLYFITGVITGLIVDRERREAQALKQAEHMALLGQAAAAMAHELKTPLVAIGGFAQRMFRDLPPDHPHRRRLRIIVDQTAHMEHLLREMLEYTRPLKLNLKTQSLNELVSEAVEMSVQDASSAGVGLVPELESRVAALEMDGARVKQVILNLIQNAVQASPRGSQVWISIRPRDSAVLVEVRDKGKGVPREMRESIFYPFFTTKSQGTGLGLAISQKIAQAHGGNLTLAPGSPPGASFLLELPLSEPRKGSLPGATPDAS